MKIRKFNIFVDYKKLRKMLLQEERWSFGSYESKLEKRKCINLYIIRNLCYSDKTYVSIENSTLLGIIGVDYHKKKLVKKLIATIALKIFCLTITKEEKEGIYEYYFGTQNAYSGSPQCQSEITLLMVNKEKRRGGVGEKLVKYVESILQTMEIANIGVNTDSCCDYQFYEKMKYTQVFKSSFNEDEIYFYKKDLKI